MITRPALILLFAAFLAPFISKAQLLEFVPNDGQWEAQIQFKAELPGGALFVEEDALTYHFVEDLRLERHGHKEEPATEPDSLIRGHAFRVEFDGAEFPLEFQAEEKLPGRINYFLGSDQSKWASNLQASRKLRAKWAEGIDLILYSQGPSLKYDFECDPGADLSTLSWSYQGLDSMQLLNGNLSLFTSLNVITEFAPVAWCVPSDPAILVGESTDISCAYELNQNRIRLKFPAIVPDSKIIVDPATWIFGSYSGSTSDNWGYSAAFDLDGNLYGAGIVFGAGYPVTMGAYQTFWAGGGFGLGCDIGITKFSADGTTNIWSTYLGGADNEFPHSIVAGSDGDLWVYGSTGSSDFPISTGAYEAAYSGGTPTTITAISFNNGTDIFVSRIDKDGDVLKGSTFVGGSANDGINTNGNTRFNYGDHARGAIIVQDSTRAYIASCSQSLDFPTTLSAYQSSSNGAQEGVIFSLNADCSNLDAATYIGGTSAEGVYSLVLNSDNSITACGGTASGDFPIPSSGWQNSYSGGQTDGFLVRMDNDLSTLEAGTFIGTPDYDQAYFVDTDTDEEVYITGQSLGNIPVTAAPYSNPGSHQFVIKFSRDLDAVVYSTVFGSGGSNIDVSPTAFLVDVCENVYVSGWGGSTNTAGGNTFGLPLTADAFQNSTDGSDFYFTVFRRDMIGLEYATYYGGGTSAEHVDGGTSRFDASGNIYQAVCAGCGSFDDFPTTPGAVSNLNLSSNCNLGVAKFQLDFTGVNADFAVSPGTIGCVPFAVDFENLSSGAVTYAWDFGDGFGSTDVDPSHTFTSTGVFTVQLIATDPLSCNISDTAWIDITVHDDSLFAGFDTIVSDFCDSLVVDFVNESISIGPDVTYLWNFGDGTFSTEENPTHSFVLPGFYTVTLLVDDPAACNTTSLTQVVVEVKPRLIAEFDAQAAACVPLDLNLFNLSAGINPSWVWDFGDGNTSTDFEPNYSYESPGTFTLSLIAVDPLSCNVTDTFSIEIEVYPLPTAAFEAVPPSGSFYQTINFQDLSTDANSWLWDFGDGESSSLQNPAHQYAEPGEYEVCLSVLSEFNCPDSVCFILRLDAESDLLFPTAFSPNGDGVNDAFTPFEWGLEDYLLRIYNRWGELLFESNDPAIGWDGTYKGKEQENGMYKVVATGLGLDGKTYGVVSDLFLVR